MSTHKGTNRLGQRLRRIIVGMAWLCALVVPSGTVLAQDLLIVLSSQSPPYVQAAQACQAQLESSGISSAQIDLKELTREDIQRIDTTVIAVGGRAASRLAHDLPAQTPLYYTMTPNPEKIGLTRRANTSGISTDVDLDEQIALMVSSPIKIRRIGVLYRSGSTNSTEMLSRIQSAIPTGWKLVSVDLDAAASESRGINDLLDEDLDLVWTLPDPAVYNSSTIKALLLQSLRMKVPVFGFSHSVVRAGAGLGIGIDPKDQGKRVANLVLQGVKNIHLNARLRVAINLIVADRIGLRLPDPFVERADVVYRSGK